jgi:hypothetical protein
VPGLTAVFRSSTPRLRYRARWWVFTVFTETLTHWPISRRDSRVASCPRTSSSLGVRSAQSDTLLLTD